MKKVSLHRLIRSTHKWTSLLVGVQLLLWTVSGLFMASTAVERVRSEHLAKEKPLFSLQGHKPLEELPVNTPLVQRASLISVGGEIAWMLQVESKEEPRQLFDAKTGVKISPLSLERATAVALAEYAGAGSIESVSRIEAPISADYHGPFPVWVATFSEPSNYRVYIDPFSGQVVARRSQLFRIYDWLWMLHIMEYKERHNFNNWLLVIAAAFALVTSISGIGLHFFVLRRSDFRLPTKRK